jgi:hypothetical protein
MAVSAQMPVVGGGVVSDEGVVGCSPMIHVIGGGREVVETRSPWCMRVLVSRPWAQCWSASGTPSLMSGG